VGRRVSKAAAGMTYIGPWISTPCSSIDRLDRLEPFPSEEMRVLFVKLETMQIDMQARCEGLARLEWTRLHAWCRAYMIPIPALI
jgi:hypothetical protein